MKYLFYLGHPAHFHLFKNVIKNITNKGHEVITLIKKKDILEELLKQSNFNYINILPEGRKDSKTGIAWGLMKRDFRLLKYCLFNRPDVMIGTSTEISHVGKLLNIPSINFNEDDASVVPMYSKLSYPWASCILSPVVCNNEKWEKKSIKYNGYHELAYLHPNHFIPDPDIAGSYINYKTPYFILRFAKLTAHHDRGIKGINTEIAKNIIELLVPFGQVLITSERTLEREFEPFRLKINTLDMHHVMAFARLYIGDSQTMAAEAGVLGIPFIRFNDFVGRSGYLNELEDKYHLGFGVLTNDNEKLYSTIKNILEIKDLQEVWKKRRKIMLNDKIDSAAFFTWFLTDYPNSRSQMIEFPEFQFTFK